MSDLELHADCHDFICNTNRAYPRGAKGVSCSCRGREQRANAEHIKLLDRIKELEAIIDDWMAAENV